MLRPLNFFYCFLLLLILLPYGLTAQSSASTSFTASVTIIEPVTIQTRANMNFATIDARQGGLVILNPDNTRIVNGEVQLELAETASAAEFEIRGQNGLSYDLQIPQGDFKMSNGVSEITIKDFTLERSSDPQNSDFQKIRMGATLEIDANQPPGRYITPTPIEVTISYN
jgi:hypothetical protein